MKSTPTCPTSFCRKRYGLNTFLEYFLQKADMDLCVLTLDDLISIGTILAFDAIRKSTSQFHRDISADRMHPCLALLFHRDYFDRPDASLSDSFAPQGLLRPTGCISIGLFCSTGITLPRSDASLSGSFVPQGLLYPGQMHLYLALLCRRDYFVRLNASLA